jgi:hypothetical protein
MDDSTKWNLGVAKLSGFRAHVRPPYREEEVGDFHGIVTLLEEATGADLSHFKIPAEKMQREVIGAQRGSYSGRPGRVFYGSKKSVDSGFFRAQLDGLASYLPTLEGVKGSARPNRYESLTDNQLKELLFDQNLKPNPGAERGLFDRAHAIAELLKSDQPLQAQPSVSNINNFYSSNVVQGSPGATITQSIGLGNEELVKIIAQLKDFSAARSLPEEDRAQIATDIQTLEVQANSKRPNKSIIKEALVSARTILEIAAGDAIAAGAIFAIQHYAVKFLGGW